MNKVLADKLEYWRSWNIPPRQGIRESAADCAARELAQMTSAEIDALSARVARYEDALTRISCQAGFNGWAWTVKTASDALDGKSPDADGGNP